MDQISVSERINSVEKISEAIFSEKLLSDERPGTNHVIENILSEGGEDFFQYLKWIGLAKESDLIVLSSTQHYHYDHNDLMGIKALINLKRLNQIKHLERFLHNLFRILPSKAFFVGHFKRGNHRVRGGIYYHFNRFFHILVSFLDAGGERNLSKKVMKELLEENDFLVLDMTDINGITYFWAQKCR